jgi:hypothetical protein
VSALVCRKATFVGGHGVGFGHGKTEITKQIRDPENRKQKLKAEKLIF